MPRLLKILFFGGVLIVSFIIFLYWMLPLDPLKQRILSEVERKLGPEYQVKIGDIGTHWILGVRLEDISLSKSIDGKEAVLVKIDSFKARVGLFSLLFGSPNYRLEVQSEGTRISTRFKKWGEGWEMNGFFKEIDLGNIPFFRRKTGLKLGSSISGDFNLRLNPNQLLQTEGEIRVDVNRLNFAKGDVSLGEAGYLSFPDILFASSGSGIKATVGERKINLETLRLKGKGFLLDLTGVVWLAQDPSQYRMNLKGSFQLPEDVWGLLDKLFSLENLKKQKRDDGTYPLSVTGNISSPQVSSEGFKIYPP